MRKVKIIFLWLLLIVLAACGLASCSTVHKIKSTEQLHLDSAGTTTKDQLQVKKIDSSGFKQIDSSYKETITVNFDTAAAMDDDLIADAFIAAVEPYFGNGEGNDFAKPGTFISAYDTKANVVPVKKKPARKPYNYTIAGNDIKSDVPIKSVTIERQGHKTEIDLFNLIKLDSGHEKNIADAHVVKDVKKSDKDKTSRTTAIWWLLLLIIAAAGVGYYALRRYHII